MEQNNCYEDEVDLTKIVIKLWKNKLFIISFTLILSIIFTFVACFVIKDKNKAKAVFTIDEVFMNSLTDNKSNNNNFQIVYSVLESKSLQDTIVKKYDLTSHFYKSEKQKNNKNYYIFKNYFSIKKENNIINIFWEDKDEEFCSKILNIIINETNLLLKNMMINDYQKIISVNKIKANRLLTNIKLYGKEYKELSDNINFMEMQLQLIEKSSIIKILDAPYLLESNSNSKKKMIVIFAGFLFSFFASVCLIYLYDFYKNIKLQLEEEKNK